MSSPPASPAALPTTPTKESITAVNKENTTPRTPLPDGPVNGAGKIIAPVEVDAPKNPGEVVQVPSTAPPPEVSIGKPDEAQKNGQVEDEHANDAEEATSDSETMGSEGTIADLPPFDWAQLQRRYTNAIQGVNKQEDEILEEFFKYSDAFSVWAGASANRDNDRASKRLKTRENFVRLREDSLETKKKHYTEVVDAFKKALALLSG